MSVRSAACSRFGGPKCLLITDHQVQNLAALSEYSEFSDRAVEALVVVCIFFFGLAVPAGAIAQTLTERTNIVLRTGLANNIPVVLFALWATVVLIWWLAVGYRPGDRVSRHLTFLVAAISVNIYLGFTVWVIVTKFVDTVASPHKLGLMVWVEPQRFDSIY
jgi:hypothetical protein